MTAFRASLLGLALSLVAITAQSQPSRAVAVFAGGCFWSMEHGMEAVPGVIDVVSGYAGGSRANPTYQNHDGHLEAVRVTYDPTRVTYPQLLARYFRMTDPTDGGGQFCDRGHSYQPAIFVANASERTAAEAAKAQAGRALAPRPIATEILPAGRFWAAEAYHQDFTRRNPARYAAYRIGCGRDASLRRVWGAQAQVAH